MRHKVKNGTKVSPSRVTQSVTCPSFGVNIAVLLCILLQHLKKDPQAVQVGEAINLVLKSLRLLEHAVATVNKHRRQDIVTSTHITDITELGKHSDSMQKFLFGESKAKELKSFCLRDRGRLGNEGRPISLKIGTQSRYVNLCNMPQSQLPRPFSSRVLDISPSGSP